MTPDEIKVVFAMMREFKVFRFKNGDVDISMEMDAPIGASAPPIDSAEVKYWSVPEPESSENNNEPVITT